MTLRKCRNLLAAFALALAACALSQPTAQAGAMTVNVNLDGSTSRTGLVGPAGGSGQTWNQFNVSSASALRDYAGNSTTLGFTLGTNGYFSSWGAPSLTLLNGAYFLGGTASSSLVITGLNPVKTYDLYLASYSAYGDGMWNMSFSTLNTTPTTSPQVVAGTGNSSTWAQGDNYARFTGVAPEASGQVTVSMSGKGAYSFCNGFQIVQTGSVPPQANILTFGLPGNPAAINGTNITLTVPYGTAVTNLAPTFTVSPGATCVPASGTARNFSTPQTYTVTFADPLITKTYTVTVDVLDLPNQSVNVNLDGSPSRTGLDGPAGGSGKTWNQYNAFTASNLLNGDNVQTTVGFTLGNNGYFSSWGAPSLTLLNGAYFLGGTATSSLVITSLVAGRTYDLYLASYSAYGSGTFNMRFSTANTTPTTSPQTVNSSAANGSVWAQGANCARFSSIVPDGTGKITVSMAGTGSYSFFNGFQLVDTTPQAIIKTFTFPGYGAAGILGSSINITVPYGTDLTALAPTYILSDGASCVPASGTSHEFTNPMHYLVTASNNSTKNYTVTVTVRAIADPEFTLSAPAAWDGRQTITVQSTITNQAALQATGGTNVNYHWSVGGVAVTKQITPGTLTLTRAQGNGPMTVTLTMDNGGFAISHSVTVAVQQPANDAWAQRTPGATEKPVPGQFFARDGTGFGTIYYNGTGAGTTPVYLKVFATPDSGTEVQYGQTLRQTPVAGAYAFTVPIAAGKVIYRLEFGTTTSGTDTLVDNTVTNLVCGDAYIIEGQSNAVAVDNSAPDDSTTNPWVRTYGRSGGGWGYANSKGSEMAIGFWGMVLAGRIVTDHHMPVCFINGAVGGTRIDEHQPNPANHTAGSGGLYSIYANLLNRVIGARLTHGIRGLFWHQGESDCSNFSGSGDWDYKTYQGYFVDMSAAWKQDYPNLQRYIIYQVEPKPCAIGPKGDQLREAQRTLPRLFSKMSILNTLGLAGYEGCHFSAFGYANIANRTAPLVSQDFYGVVPAASVSAPNLRRAWFTTSARTAIALEFDQPMSWSSFSIPNCYLDKVGGKITSGSASGNVVTLQLSSAAAPTATLDYLEDNYWDPGESVSSLLHGANGIAALTFADVPIAPASGSLSCSGASSLTSTSAVLNATLDCLGTSYSVYAYWNTSNGGTSPALWTNSAYVGSWTNVASTNLGFAAAGLAPGKTYYFTFRAMNALDTLWATNVQSFTTLAPPPAPVLPGGAITVSGGVPTFTFATVTGYKYRLACKSALSDTSWVPVIAPPGFPLPNGWSATSSGAPMWLIDTNAVGLPQRFYRLEAGSP